MKIHELSALSGCNAETIRMYRKKGLLRPAQDPQNGYYDYSQEDITMLLYIRRLRQNRLPLSSISGLFYTYSVESLIGNYQDEIRAIRQEIAELEKQLGALELMKNHLEACIDTEQKILTLSVTDPRYDLYHFSTPRTKEESDWLANLSLHTTSLRISGDIQALREGKEWIACEAGIGTYGTVVNQYGLTVPEGAVFCPPGTYLTTLVRLHTLDRIPAGQLLPLSQYAEKNHLRLTGDSTAFLLRAAYPEGQPEFWFRLRVRVEPF